MSTLKPCPFCSAAEPMVFLPTAKASDPYSPWDRLYPIVRCRSCHAEVCGADGDSLCKTAIEKWNVRVAAQPAPVAWVAADTLHSPHPACVSSLTYMSQLDKDQGREYAPLYAAPAAAHADEAVKLFINKVEKIAMSMKAPNIYTPQLMEACAAMNAAMQRTSDGGAA